MPHGSGVSKNIQTSHSGPSECSHRSGQAFAPCSIVDVPVRTLQRGSMAAPNLSEEEAIHTPIMAIYRSIAVCTYKPDSLGLHVPGLEAIHRLQASPLTSMARLSMFRLAIRLAKNPSTEVFAFVINALQVNRSWMTVSDKSPNGPTVDQTRRQTCSQTIRK